LFTEGLKPEWGLPKFPNLDYRILQSILTTFESSVFFKAAGAVVKIVSSQTIISKFSLSKNLWNVQYTKKFENLCWSYTTLMFSIFSTRSDSLSSSIIPYLSKLTIWRWWRKNNGKKSWQQTIRKIKTNVQIVSVKRQIIISKKYIKLFWKSHLM